MEEKNAEAVETNASAKGPDADPEQEAGKTFTQEEVNKIVENRLNRERRKLSSALIGEDPREAELAEREKAVLKKELQAEARAWIANKGLPPESLDLLDYLDKESCNKSLEKLEAVINEAVQARIGAVVKGGAPMKKAPESKDQDAALRAAFRLPAR